MFWFPVLVLVLLVCSITRFYLSGEALSAYDKPSGAHFSEGKEASPQLREVEKLFAGMASMTRGVPRKQQLKIMRDFLDSWGGNVVFDGETVPVDSAGIKGEWIILPGANSACRCL